MSIEGRCNCGEVRFRLNDAPQDVYVCHCSICRRATGSNGIAVTLVERDAFEWLAGHELVRTWRKPDGDYSCAFCARCGSPLPADNDPERLFVPAGLLPDDGAALRVAAHIFVDSRAAWDEIGDDGVRHPEAFGS